MPDLLPATRWRLAAADKADLAWTAFVTVLLVLSPLTGAKRLVPSLVLGLLGGAAFLVARLRWKAVDGPLPRSPAIATPHPGLWVLPVALLVLFAPTLAWLYDEYTESIWRNPHGLFVPLFAALLARHRLRQETDAQPQSSAWGFALLAPACVLAVLDAGIRSHYLSLLGLLLALPGLSLLLLGAARTRRLAFPLCLCLFLTPLPLGLGNPFLLPTLSAELGRLVVETAGIPVARSGTYLELANGLVIEVTQTCSGTSFFYAGCAFAALCFPVTRSWPRRLGLLIAPYVLTALGNGLRVAVVVGASAFYGIDWKYTTPVHGLMGTAVCLGVLAGIWLLCDRRALREALS